MSVAKELSELRCAFPQDGWMLPTLRAGRLRRLVLMGSCDEAAAIAACTGLVSFAMDRTLLKSDVRGIVDACIKNPTVSRVDLTTYKKWSYSGPDDGPEWTVKIRSRDELVAWVAPQQPPVEVEREEIKDSSHTELEFFAPEEDFGGQVFKMADDGTLFGAGDAIGTDVGTILRNLPDGRVREAWKAGDHVEVFSGSAQKWFPGNISEICHDEDGEFLVVKYTLDDGRARVKEVEREDVETIRPIAMDHGTWDEDTFDDDKMMRPISVNDGVLDDELDLKN